MSPRECRGVLVSSIFLFSIAALGILAPGCNSSSDDTVVLEEPPAAIPSELDPTDDPPGVNFAVSRILGATGPGGAFRPGDRLTFEFTVTTDDGDPWELSHLTSVRALVSGPTFNYQRVLAEKNDVIARATRIGAGEYSYAFADPIPARYLAPVGASDGSGPGEGNLSGEPLLAGTYTLGLYGNWGYTVLGEEYRDHGDTTLDFLLGSAAAVEPREVVTQPHCDQCHSEIQAHGGVRHKVTICLLCHTAGSGSPGASVDFKVMIHRIHNGAHLPSVLGVSTNADGSRNYVTEPVPYEFANVEFPVWPNAASPLPRDAGHAALPAEAQALEDRIRMGAADCAKCHGDPDGNGPIAAPAQGELAYAQPTRASCGSCHDDVDWELPYVANFQTMPPQLEDGACLVCHPTDGTQLATRDVHRHPLQDPSFSPGINFEIASVTEAGTPDGDGTIDPGEKIAVTFSVRDDAGNAIVPSSVVTSISFALSGPRQNSNLLLSSSLSTSILSGAQPYKVNLPQNVVLDFVGESDGDATDVFTTAFAPLRPEGTTTIRARSGSIGSPASLTAAIAPLDNWAEVSDASAFAMNDFLVIDDGEPSEEYFQVQHVEGKRIWFSTGQTHAARFAHAVAAAVQEVTLSTLTAGTHYMLDAATGTITEVGELGAGTEVLASYTTDFVLPGAHPRPFNASPDIGETQGEWAGKPLVDGAYTVTFWTADSLTLTRFGETNSYQAASPSAAKDFLVGSATSIEPYDKLSSGDNCNSCHGDLYFHGLGRRGFAACIACHGTAGSEDRPQYVAPNAPDTPGTTIDFRTMLHKIHMGERLTQGADYQVIGFGSGFPNNYSVHTYDDVAFPPMPDGPKDCVACHGENNAAYREPGSRDHPTEQGEPAQVWSVACLSCHDSTSAAAHAATQLDANGFEACAVCHGPGRSLEAALVHKIRQP